MILAIMQPFYIGWTGYFDLMNSVDKFVFLDDVKLEKCSWQVRNKIKSGEGKYQYLTIPVNSTMETKINETQLIQNNPWKRKHLMAIKTNYSKSKYFNEVYEFIEKLLNYETNNLSDLTIQISTRIARKIGIETAFYKTSELIQDGYTFDGIKDERIADICEKLGCKDYLSPVGSSDYIEKRIPGGAFFEKKINLYYQNYKCAEYEQLNGEFMPFMSIVDLLFNEGLHNALDVIKKGHSEPMGYLEFRKNVLKLECLF